MAGLNFQTQTIINSNLDPDSGKNVKLFEAGDEMLHIKREFQFWKDKQGYGKVLCVNKKEGYEPKLCKATIDFAEVLSQLSTAFSGSLPSKVYCRLDIYLGVEGAEPFIYSTPWIQKGMPFWLEFTVKSTDTAAVLAANVAKVIKKDHLFLCDKDLIDVTVDGTKLVLEGASEYQRFRKIEISYFNVTDDYAESLVSLGETGITLDERGLNGFGTYSQIIKDLRLPTAANYQWLHIRQVETPILGELYDQYIIEYEAPAVNDGLHAVGQRMTTTTLHVFWVRHDENLISEWETALTAICDDINDYSLPTESEEEPEEGGEETK